MTLGKRLKEFGGGSRNATLDLEDEPLETEFADGKQIPVFTNRDAKVASSVAAKALTINPQGYTIPKTKAQVLKSAGERSSLMRSSPKVNVDDGGPEPHEVQAMNKQAAPSGGSGRHQEGRSRDRPKREREEESVDLTGSGDEALPMSVDPPAHQRTSSAAATQPPPPPPPPDGDFIEAPPPRTKATAERRANQPGAPGRFVCSTFGNEMESQGRNGLEEHQRLQSHRPVDRRSPRGAAGPAAVPAPAPAEASRTVDRGLSASVPPGQPTTCQTTLRSQTSVDLSQEPDEPSVSIQMRKVDLGTFECGACQVVFTETVIRFYPDEGCRPHGYEEEIELEMSALTRIEIDKKKQLMCVTGFFGYEIEGHFSCFTNPVRSRALFHIDAKGDAPYPWGTDVQRIMHLSDGIKVKTHFNPQQTDFATELRRFKRERAASNEPQRPKRNPTGHGSTLGSRQQRAAASGSGGAGRRSGSSCSGDFPSCPERGQRVDSKQPLISSHTVSRSTPTQPEQRSLRQSARRSSGGSREWGGDLTYTRRRKNNAKVLIWPAETAKDAVTLTEEECDRLRDREYLNDSLVDFELKRIQERLRGAPDGEAKLARCHFFNSFFYKRLLESLQKPLRRKNPAGVREAFKRVERWTKHIDLFKKDFLFVPINESLHWSLAIICNPGALVPKADVAGDDAATVSEAEEDEDAQCDGGAGELQAVGESSDGSETDVSRDEAMDGRVTDDVAMGVGPGDALDEGSRDTPSPLPPTAEVRTGQEAPQVQGASDGDDSDGVESEEGDGGGADDGQPAASMGAESQPVGNGDGHRVWGPLPSHPQHRPASGDMADALNGAFSDGSGSNGGGGGGSGGAGDEDADDEDFVWDTGKPGCDAVADLVEAGHERRSGAVSVEPCLLYLDSLDGKKEQALDLLRAYLHEEQHARRRKREAAAAAEAKPEVKPEVKPEARREDLMPVVPGRGKGAKIVPFATPAPPMPSSSTQATETETVASQTSNGSEVQETGACVVPSSPSLGEGMLQEEHDEAAEEERAFTKESLRTFNVKVRAQHNHSDCGLYMLRYIELLSLHPECALWETQRWASHPELRFSEHDINQKRQDLCAEIRSLGDKQSSEKVAARRATEESAAGGEESSASAEQHG